MDIIRSLASRAVGAGVAAVAATLASAGIDLPPEFAASLTTAGTLLVYGVVHRVIDRYINPADRARAE